MKVSCAVYNLKGEDKVIHNPVRENCMIVGIADGHGGDDTAIHCRNCVHALRDVPTDFETLFQSLNDFAATLDTSGCALTICTYDNGTLRCANVGDALCIVVTQDSYYWMTTSHRLQDNAQERMRFKSYVGFIASNNSPSGPPRLFPGGIACSRSIGDKDCQHKTCVPSCSEASLCEDDIVVIASDGLWDSCNVSKICENVRYYRSAKSLIGACSRLLDDTSVIVLSNTAERTSLFKRVSSNSSISSDDDEMPVRKVLKVVL